jgi:hypothetical protein
MGLFFLLLPPDPAALLEQSWSKTTPQHASYAAGRGTQPPYRAPMTKHSANDLRLQGSVRNRARLSSVCGPPPAGRSWGG